MPDPVRHMAAAALLAVAAVALLGACGGSLDADFEVRPESGRAPLEVRFIDASSGERTGWRWDFGDGGTSQEQSPTHVYEQAGGHDVTLVVLSPQASATITKDAAVTVAPGPLARAEVLGATPTVESGQTHRFAARALDAFGNEINGVSATWSSGGGGIIDSGGVYRALRRAGHFAQAVKARMTHEGRTFTGVMGVTVLASQPVELVIEQPLVVPARGTLFLSAVGVDRFSNEVLLDDVRWSVVPAAGKLDASANDVLHVTAVPGVYANAVTAVIEVGGEVLTASADLTVIR